MSLSENLRMAWRALKANRMRSLLTMLGITIGVGAVIAMVAIGDGAQARVTNQIAALGTNLLVVVAIPPTVNGVRLPPDQAKSLTRADADAIASEVPSVAAVAPEVVKNAQVVAGRQNTNVRIDGTSPAYPQIRKYDLAQGRFFSDAEAVTGALVAVLGASTAQSLFPDGNAVGQPLVIDQIPFEVIGVLAAKGLSGPENRDAIVFVPIVAAQYRLIGSQSVSSINIEARSLALMSDAKEEITSLLSRRHAITDGAAADFSVNSQEDVLATSSGIADTFTLLLAGIAGVSLLVGGIGIMNIMLVSVTERTREIGIRKAIGATREVILTQFLIEATVLSLAGGILGVLGGIGAAQLVGVVAGWPTQVDPLVVLMAVGFSAAIGLFFGIYPARHAARLDPIEALRFE